MSLWSDFIGIGYAERFNVEDGAVTKSFSPAVSQNRVASTAPGDGFLDAIVQWDSLLFGFICLIDMVSTVYFVCTGMAREANPWLAYWMDQGVVSFVFVKLLSFLPTLAVAAYYRNTYPKFIEVGLRCALAGYVAIYVGSVLHQPGVIMAFVQ